MLKMHQTENVYLIIIFSVVQYHSWPADASPFLCWKERQKSSFLSWKKPGPSTCGFYQEMTSNHYHQKTFFPLVCNWIVATFDWWFDDIISVNNFHQKIAYGTKFLPSLVGVKFDFQSLSQAAAIVGLILAMKIRVIKGCNHVIVRRTLMEKGGKRKRYYYLSRFSWRKTETKNNSTIFRGRQHATLRFCSKQQKKVKKSGN